jgi:hypothetical protein
MTVRTSDPTLQGRTFELKILLSNTNTNTNKGGEFVSFYLEYEYKFELERVCYCVYMYTCIDMCHATVVLIVHHSWW